MNLGLNARTALVCGASSGLGRAVAAALASEGARVAINARHSAPLDRTAAELTRTCGTEVLPFAADVAVPAEAAALAARVTEQLGRIDILFCNAGGPPATSFADAPAGSWQDALELNLLSTIHLCRAAVPSMRQRGWGRVLCLTSIAALQPMPGLILSATARAGVLGFAKSLADETAPDGVTVNVICPGYFETGRVHSLAETRAEGAGRSTEEMLEETAAQVPAGRLGDPAELGAAAAFLASERAGYITGSVLCIDGGLHRSITQ